MARMMRETVYRMMQIDDWNNATSYSKCTVQRKESLSYLLRNSQIFCWDHLRLDLPGKRFREDDLACILLFACLPPVSG